MKRFVEAVKNMFRIQDLRNRVLFTLALLAVYRIGAYIPIPGINSAVLDQLFNQAAGSVLGIFNLFRLYACTSLICSNIDSSTHYCNPSLF